MNAPRALVLALTSAAIVAAAPALASDQTEALDIGFVTLCGDGQMEPDSFDDAEELSKYGYRPGTAEDETNLFLGGVQGQMALWGEGEDRIRVAAFPEKGCMVYVFGDGRMSAFAELRQRLVDDYSFTVLEDSAENVAMEVESVEGDKLRVYATNVEGAGASFLTISATFVDAPAD